jgi:hypothetical protein
MPICWQGYALLTGGILVTVVVAIAATALFGRAGWALLPILILVGLAILFALVARRTEA